MHGCKIMREYSIMSVNVYIHTGIMWLQISVKTNASSGWKIDLWYSNSLASLKSHGWVNEKSKGMIPLYQNISNKDNHTVMR